MVLSPSYEQWMCLGIQRPTHITLLTGHYNYVSLYTFVQIIEIDFAIDDECCTEVLILPIMHHFI